MKAFVDQETCTGCGLCAQVCPDVFRMEGDMAIVYSDPVSETNMEECRQAADDCPVEAIKIEG